MRENVLSPADRLFWARWWMPRGAAGGTAGWMPRDRARLRRRHEVDQLLDPAEQRRLEVAVSMHPREHSLPREPEVFFRLSWPAEGAANAGLPVGAARNLRPTLNAHRRRRHALPDVNERVPNDNHVLAMGAGCHGRRNARLFRARHKVVDKHAVTAFRRGRVVAQHVVEQVDALQIFNNDALDAQVGAPHLLDEFGVMAAFNKNAARQRNARAGIGDRERSRCCASGRLRLGCRRDEDHGQSVNEKAVAERKEAQLAVPIFELNELAVNAGDRAAVSVVGPLDHEISLCANLGRLHSTGITPAFGQHIAAVSVIHSHSLGYAGVERTGDTPTTKVRGGYLGHTAPVDAPRGAPIDSNPVCTKVSVRGTTQGGGAMHSRWAMALAAVTVFAGVAIGAPASAAEHSLLERPGSTTTTLVPAVAPVTLGAGYVLDDAGVLSASDEQAAQARLEQLRADTGVDMWVAFVPEFTSPADAQDWANDTASKNGLGPTQYLLAVATDTRQYYLSGDSSGPLTDSQLGTIEQQQIQPALAKLDWLGAVDAAAAGITSAIAGGSGAPGGSNGGGTPGAADTGGSFVWLFVLLLVFVAIGVVIWAIASRRKKAAGGAVGPGAAARPQISIAELSRQAGSALVATDDAIRTSEEELGFARAQFGDAATADFETVLATAKANLNQAFTLKQQLDDSEPDTEEETRTWNTQILQLCHDANAALDAKAADFDELRKLEANAPEALTHVQGERAKAEPTVAAAAHSLQTLAGRYSPTALATVSDNPAQAATRLAFADEQLALAQRLIGEGKGGEAAVSIRAAEEAVDQALLLAHAVDKLGADLATGEQSIVAAIANLEQDVAEASRLPDADGRVAGAIAAATAQIEASRTALAAPTIAPLQVLQGLEAANTQIDGVIAGVRDAAAAQQRAQQAVGQAVLSAQGQVSAAEDYITARRGAVGAEARTRLAEAGASLVHAQQLQNSDLQQALNYAQRANQLAAQAIQFAQRDVGSFEQQQGGGGSNIAGAVLGGIVINSLLGGGGRGRTSGGGMGSFGGGFGGSSGGRSGGGRTSGSFGGGGTRSRRGGGRF